MVTLADIEAAAARIAPHIHRTPIMTSQQIDELAGAKLFFKCENFQKAGAFKTRGAVNAVFSLQPDELKQGVATHSSGNHGAALARAAGLRGIPAHIVMPENARRVKQEAVKAYGGSVITCEPTLAAREQTLARVLAETGAREIHPYDNDEVIAGQGTTALELFQQVPDLDALIIPVGGGGLLAGCALVAAVQGAAVMGAEPAGADDACRSLRTGQRVSSHTPETICDGLLTVLGQRNFEIIRERVADVLLVPDPETVAAMNLISTRMKIVVEPSAAIVLAALLKHRERIAAGRIGLVLTGGNIEPASLKLP